uniref:Uncharacterized protein n=1 Tax=Ralstonia syzygii R24 TaxID=907261 RepID=G3ACL3_9RALS|nr:conserved hypothetical protein [Ralstonia syzygii R24]
MQGQCGERAQAVLRQRLDPLAAKGCALPACGSHAFGIELPGFAGDIQNALHRGIHRGSTTHD